MKSVLRSLKPTYHLKKGWLEDDRFLLGWLPGRCYVSFWGCNFFPALLSHPTIETTGSGLIEAIFSTFQYGLQGLCSTLAVEKDPAKGVFVSQDLHFFGDKNSGKKRGD